MLISKKTIFVSIFTVTAVFASLCMYSISQASVDEGNPPSLVSFTSDPSSGLFGDGGTITIYANFQEDLDPTSTMDIVLDTGASVTLNSVSGTSVSGAYVVAGGQNSSDLTVASISGCSITDMDTSPINITSCSIPGGQNLGDNSSVTIDTTAPSFVSAAVNGTSLVLTYDGSLDGGSVPSVSDFSVSNGSSVGVSSVGVSGTDVTLTLASTVGGGTTVTVDYTPGGSPIQDGGGNDAASLSSQAVTNNTETSPPTLSTADVNDITLTLTYNEDLDPSSIPSTSAFSVSNGSPISVSSVNVTGSTVVLTLASTVGDGTTVTVSYAPDGSPIQDLALNDAVSLTDQAVTNNTPDATPPTLDTATVAGDTLTLTYNEALDTGSTPATTDFVVTVDASPVSISSVNVTGSTVVVTLDSAVSEGVTVTVSYTPGGSPIQDTLGNDAGAFSDQSVTNNTDTTPPTLSTAVVDGTALTLTYNEALDTGSTPTTTDFVVTVDASPVSISSVNVTGSTVVVTLAASVNLDTAVTIDYTPGGSPIQDLAHNDAAALNDQTVTNNTITCSTITVGSGPDFSSVAGTNVYLSNIGSNNVSVIDANPASSTFNTVTATIPVGTNPHFSSVVGTNVYIINQSSSNVSVIDADPSSGTFNTRIATISVGSTPHFSVVVGTNVYVTQGSNAVKVIDANPSSGTFNTVIATITVGSGPFYSAAAGTNVYINNQGSNNVSVIDADPSSGTFNTVIATITVGAQPTFSSVVGTNVYVTNTSGNNVSVIDADPSSGTFNTRIATINMGSSPTYSSVVGKRVYIVNGSSNNVKVIDADPTSGTFNTVIATITVGTNPNFSSVVGTKVYVTNQTTRNISIIDADPSSGAFNTVIATSVVGSGPFYSAAAGTNVYVSSPGTGAMSVINALSNTLLNVCAPNLRSITSSTSDGTYGSGESINITANFSEALGVGSKMRVTLNTGDVVDLTTVSTSTLSGTYVVGSGDASPDLSVSSISSSSSFTSVVDGSSNTRTSFGVPSSPDLTGDSYGNLGDNKNIIIGSAPISISVGTEPYQMATVGSLVYVANQGSDNVKVINSVTNAVTATINVGSQPYGVAYNSTSKEVYVANLKGNTVSVIDADPISGTFNTVTNTISVGIEPYYVASSGTNIYVTNSVSGSVSVISTSTHTVTATIRGLIFPRGIKAHSSNGKLYAANFGSQYGVGYGAGTISVINSADNTIAATILVGSGARGVAVNGNEVYVANFNDDTVSVISTTTNLVTHTISVGDKPRGILSSGSNIYVENYGDGTISKISTGSHTVTNTIKVGNTPAGMTAVGADIYLTRFTDGKVSILNPSTNTLSNSVPLLSSATVNSNIITLTYDTALDTGSTPTTTDFSVSNGSTISVSSVNVTGSTVVLTLASSVGGGTTVTVSYTPGTNPIQDSSANHVAPLTSQAVTNDTETTGAILSAGLPSGVQLATTTSVNLSVATDEAATCKYGTIVDTSYDAIADTFTSTGGTNHSATVPVLSGSSYTFYVRCADAENNKNTSDFIITFSIDTASSSPNVGGTGSGGFYIPPVNIPVIPGTGIGIPSSVRFVTNLALGAFVDDVKELQKFLNAKGFTVASTGAGSSGKETNYFGLNTTRALIAFQKAYHIIPSIGFFGPITRGVVNGILSGTPQTSTPTPTPPVALNLRLLCGVSLYLKAPVKLGGINESHDVFLIENFLNAYEGESLTLNGIYEKADFDAVIRFQEKYASVVLAPQGLTHGTGYVFSGTMSQIEKIVSGYCK